MNSLFKKIIAGFCAISITISCVVPAFAANQTEVTSEFGTFWEQYLKWQYDVSEIFGDNIGGFCKLVAVGLSADLCGKSDDSKHHGYITGPAVTLFGETKYPAKCNLCGQGFSVTDAQISDAYTEAVNQMPATGYDSAGKLLWQPRWIDDTSQWGLYIYSGAAIAKYPDIGVTPTDYVSANVNGAIISLNVLQNNASLSVSSSTWVGPALGGYNYDHYFRAPIVGTYTRLSSDSFSGSFFTSKGASQLQYKWKAETVGNFGIGDRVDCGSTNSISLSNLKSGTFNLCTPVFQIKPYTPTVINNTYNINTRVNNFQGDYYDNVTNNYYNNTTIINETTNNYYDMTTNNYYTMSNWSYDYQSRTYFVTLEDGTTITVQFGDDCLTITNNNVENSYQYVINNNTPSPNPETPSTCKHNWTETIDVAPTCLEGGHANFTCSLCGETYEQILSAKGHNWTVKEHVNTVYGENGVIVTQGHTLYECSACGEQWYTETATPPPDVSGGSSIRSWLQAFQLWLDGKLDSLFSAADAPIISRLDAILAELQSAPGSAACEHTYTQHTEQEATCTLPGLLIFTCSQCGDSYSEIVDPLGHDWIVTSHVDAVTDPETGEETASAYDVYTCSRCQRTYEDHDGSGPEEDYSSSSISKLVVKMFSRLGTFAGKLIGSVIHLFDKAITALDNVVSKFNEYVEQISGFGGGYPAWLTGFWGVLPAELQVALTFAVICMALGVVGKKLFFS